MISEQYQKGLYALSATLLAYGTNRIFIESQLKRMGIDEEDTNLDETMSMVSAICGGLIATIAEDVDYSKKLTFAPLLGAVSFTWLSSGVMLLYLERKGRLVLLSEDVEEVEQFVNKSTLVGGVLAFVSAVLVNKARSAQKLAPPTDNLDPEYPMLPNVSRHGTLWDSVQGATGVGYGSPRPITRYY
jgi:hypothetical protein